MTQNIIERYAVIGNPIAHSKSPAIHSAFAKQTGEQLNYTAERVEPGRVKEFIDSFSQQNGKGLNITVPFKQDAYELATHLSERAKRAGAVNTLSINENSLSGDTTDGVGLLNDLKKNHGQTIQNKQVLVIGAGGAVRGTLEPLLLEKPENLVVVNRTLSKAQQLTEIFSDLGDISACSFNELQGKQFDLIINGTSASLSGDLPPLPEQLFAENACAYDMMYASAATVFMHWAKEQQAKYIYDGLGMLVEQAAESFYIWRNKYPETQSVIKQLRTEIQR
ncbi:Shikimate 5-dehydrogenase I alpha [hydrothermal vent metagenome]|uniref:shikimate dehydrogenase (NADP(+)) n=1 Tax=hydrothermal vent metagenome TaxID=652676 RepID=A0A3B0XHW0_9ZZZZ